MGRTSLTSHKIDTGDQRPIKQQPRRLPFSKLETAQNARARGHGMVERFNQTLENGLSMFVNDHQTDWDKHIPLLLMAYRTAKHQTTKLTPSRMIFGREIKLPIDLWAGRPEDSRMADGPTYI